MCGAIWPDEKQKIAPRAKHISKSKLTKHTMCRALLGVQMLKNCASLWCEACFEISIFEDLISGLQWPCHLIVFLSMSHLCKFLVSCFILWCWKLVQTYESSHVRRRSLKPMLTLSEDWICTTKICVHINSFLEVDWLADLGGWCRKFRHSTSFPMFVLAIFRQSLVLCMAATTFGWWCCRWHSTRHMPITTGGVDEMMRGSTTTYVCSFQLTRWDWAPHFLI